MASLTKLRRRLKKWQRYARRYRPGLWPRNYNVVQPDVRDTPGFLRAYNGVHFEREKQQRREAWSTYGAGED